MKEKIKYSMSLAASWAWGTSLIVGMELIQTKGIVTFAIWALANSLAIPLFGFLAHRIPGLKKVVSSKPVIIFTTIVTVFCLWIQMNAIFQQTSELLENIPPIAIKGCIMVIFVLLGLFLLNNGIKKSVQIDFPMWICCYGVLFCVLLMGILGGVLRNDISWGYNAENLKWAFNSCWILFSGPVMCIQNWQMAQVLQEENQTDAHYLSGIWFALYMVFVGMLGIYHFDGKMQLLMIVVVIIVAFSTADSAIVGLQEFAGKKVGLCVEIFAVTFWPLVVSVGVMNLWTIMGNMRKYVAVICVVIGMILTIKGEKYYGK